MELGVKLYVLRSAYPEGLTVNKQLQSKARLPIAGRKGVIALHSKSGMLTAYRNAGAVVEEHATKSLSVRVLSSGTSRGRTSRAPHLSDMEKELAELKKVVAALAVRSVIEDEVLSFDQEGMTVLDADIADQLLDNPPEPNEALRNLLALR